jgi:cell wall-associated NlpC family hydrolase
MLWGGEGGMGIDCSGLPRRAYRDAMLSQGLQTLNGSLTRAWLDQWWHDAGARFMADDAGRLIFLPKDADHGSDAGMARGDNLFRQWELLKVLQANRSGLSIEALAERLECNKRTVQRDLSVLQDIFHISTEQHDRGKKYWKLAQNTIESEQLQLTMPKMLSLFLSQQLLLPLGGTLRA